MRLEKIHKISIRFLKGGILLDSPEAICPICKGTNELEEVLTAQSNQNVIYKCQKCDYTIRNIETKKG